MEYGYHLQHTDNEKIMGDVLLQKTFTADYLTKRRVKNSGQQKQYYVKNHHEQSSRRPSITRYRRRLPDAPR